jgi:hypothetical protein
MTCRLALRTPFNTQQENRGAQITDMKTLLEKSKKQVLRPQKAAEETEQHWQPQANA